MLLIQTNAIADALNSSEWVFPIAECFHITAFAWSIGLIALVDYRLLGFGIGHSTPSQVAKATAPWTLLGLAVVLLSGPILFLSDVRMYLHNPSFRFKIGALAIALIFNYTDPSQGCYVRQFVAGSARGSRRGFASIVD